MKTFDTTTFVLVYSLMLLFCAAVAPIARAETTLYLETYQGEQGFPTNPEIDRLDLGGMIATSGGATAVLPPLPMLTGDRVTSRVVSTGGAAYPNENASTYVLNAQTILGRQEPFSLTGRFENFNVQPNDGVSDGLVTMLLWNTTSEYFVSASVFLVNLGTTFYPILYIQEWTPAGLPIHIEGIALPGVPVTSVPFDLTLVVDPASNSVSSRLKVNDLTYETTAMTLQNGNLQDPQIDSMTQTLLVGNNAANNTGPGDVAAVDFREFRVTTPVNHARIDVKPLEPKNIINTASREPTPVAILSSFEFDAMTIVPASLSLAGAPVATSTRGKPLCRSAFVNRDRRADLVCSVVTSRIDAPLGESVVKLTAETAKGEPVIGQDTIRRVR
jgi:hypothetical protein